MNVIFSPVSYLGSLLDKRGTILIANSTTSSALLGMLATLEDTSIVAAVAGNPCCDVRTLTRLSDHEQSNVRAAVADNESTPASILEKLSQDDSPDVRLEMASNPGLAIHFLILLAEDENPYVACRAIETLRRLRTFNESQAA